MKLIINFYELIDFFKKGRITLKDKTYRYGDFNLSDYSSFQKKLHELHSNFEKEIHQFFFDEKKNKHEIITLLQSEITIASEAFKASLLDFEDSPLHKPYQLEKLKLRKEKPYEKTLYDFFNIKESILIKTDKLIDKISREVISNTPRVSGESEINKPELADSSKAIFHLSKVEIAMLFLLFEKSKIIEFTSNPNRNSFIERNFKYHFKKGETNAIRDIVKIKDEYTTIDGNHTPVAFDSTKKKLLKKITTLLDIEYVDSNNEHSKRNKTIPPVI